MTLFWGIYLNSGKIALQTLLSLGFYYILCCWMLQRWALLSAEGDFNVRHGMAAAVYTSVNRWVAGLPRLLIFLFVIYPKAFVCLARLPSKPNPKYWRPTSKRSFSFLLLLILPGLHILSRSPPSHRLTPQTVLGSSHPTLPLLVIDANN